MFVFSEPPQLLKNNDSMSFHMKAVKAQLIRLTCQFDTGFPKSQVVWFKNGNEMKMNCRTRMKISGESESESKPNYELVMTGSEQSDSGIYQCRASNQAGTAQAVTFLEMESKGRILQVFRVVINKFCIDYRKVNLNYLNFWSLDRIFFMLNIGSSFFCISSPPRQMKADRK